MSRSKLRMIDSILRKESALILSIIVPVYNDWARAVLLKDDLVEDFLEFESNSIHDVASLNLEIIFVDNGSLEVPVLEQSSISNLVVKQFKCMKKGSYSARNYGVTLSSGRYLLFLDSDVSIRCGFITSVLSNIAVVERGDIVAGGVKMYHEHRKDRFLITANYDYCFGLLQHRYVKAQRAVTANFLIERGFFEAYGRFNELLISGGDFDFCKRASLQGAEIVFSEKMVVFHPSRPGFASLCNKQIRIINGQLTQGIYSSIRVFLRFLTAPFVDLIRMRDARGGVFVKSYALCFSCVLAFLTPVFYFLALLNWKGKIR